MPDSIKKQIMDRIASNLAPLRPTTFRDITRELDSTSEHKTKKQILLGHLALRRCWNAIG